MPTLEPLGPFSSTPVPTTLSSPHRVAQTVASELPAAQVLLGLLPSQGHPHGQRLSMATRALKGLCRQQKARASRRHLITRASRFFALTRRAKAKEQGRQEARRRPGQSSGWNQQSSGPDAVHLPRPSEQAELAPAGDTQPYQTRGNVPYLPCPPCCPTQRASRVGHRQERDYRLPPPSGRAARTRPPLHRPVRAATCGGVRRKGPDLRRARDAATVCRARPQ